ncbi:MAG: hypothetical protein GVY29_09920 [Spirochaetes bacterium]|jgi:hypothetical protein|nr:hypothetical protein [Spirochaetota bacterium]
MAERVIALWVQERWPGAGKHIFCLRESDPTAEADFREIDRVPITRLDCYGKQLSVIRIRSTLQTLKREGRIESEGPGRASQWRVLCRGGVARAVARAGWIHYA